MPEPALVVVIPVDQAKTPYVLSVADASSGTHDLSTPMDHVQAKQDEMENCLSNKGALPPIAEVQKLLKSKNFAIWYACNPTCVYHNGRWYCY